MKVACTALIMLFCANGSLITCSHAIIKYVGPDVLKKLDEVILEPLAPTF